MAVYKVIQDVEAEDKIVGSLSLKQLIFAAVAVGLAFAGFRISMEVGSFFVIIPFLPFIIVFVLLAAPLGRQQSTELWLAAQVHYYTKPRIRIWDQSDIKQLVHITVPKKAEKFYTDGLNQQQVKSRISALASAMDTRGQAIAQPSQSSGYIKRSSKRLLNSKKSSASQANDIAPQDDILDESNSTAQHFAKMMQESDINHKQRVIESLKNPKPKQQEQESPEDYWFMHQTTPIETSVKPGMAMFDNSVIHPGEDLESSVIPHAAQETEEEKALIHKKVEFAGKSSLNPHHKTLLTPDQIAEKEEQERIIKEQEQKLEQQRLAQEQAEKQRQEQEPKRKTRLTKTDTIELAYDNSLSVSSVQHLADRKAAHHENPKEVVVKLH